MAIDPTTFPALRRGGSGPEATDSGGAVDSVFGRIGVVVAVVGDYDSDQIDNASTVSGATVTDALEWLASNAGAVDSVFGRTGAVVAQSNDYTAAQIDWTALADGGQLIRHGSTVESVGSATADVAATSTRTPSTDKICTLWLAALVNTSQVLTLNDSSFAQLTVSLIVGASSGTGRWTARNQDLSDAWVQPDAGAWLLDLQWSAATSVWVVAGVKPRA